MYGDFIGERIKKIREEVFKTNQTEFAAEIHDYIIRKHGTKLAETLNIHQGVISVAELHSRMRRDKFALLINFLYSERRINPSWILLEQNKTQPLYITKLVIDKSLLEKQKEIQEYAEKIHQTINDIEIVIQNSAFN